MALVMVAAFFGALLFVFFKAFGQRNVPLLPAVVVNYVVAFLLGMAFSLPWNVAELTGLWLPSALQGALFIGLFQLMGISSQRAGIAPTTVASKMSLALTVVLMVLLYDEKPLPVAWAGIGLALIGVAFSSWKGGKHGTHDWWMLPLIFVASAGSDLLLNEAQRRWVTPTTEAAFPTIIFGFAALFGLLWLVSKKQLASLRRTGVWIGGASLGCVNFGSLYFLVMALSRSGMAGSTVFPLMNVGVILFGTAASLILFKEKLRPLQVAGIVLSIVALALIFSART